MTTPKAGIAEWVSAQASPDVTVNAAIRKLEQGGRFYVVKDKDLTSAPGSPADGDAYIVATAGGGWSAFSAKDIAIYVSTAWVKVTPEEGVFAWVQDENLLYYYDGSAWAAYSASSAGGLLAANNLSDVANAGTSRTNLGLTANGSSLVTAANYAAMRTLLSLVVGTDVQAFDADLSALAALSGTDTIYRRSGANTWTAVTFGANVSFTGGKLSVVPRVSSAASVASPLAWNSDNFDQYAYTALANALTLNADAGTPVDGQKIVFRIKDNGSARALTWTTGSAGAFRAIGVTLPTTTVVNKTVYVGCIYNAADSRWDAVAVAQEV